MNQFDLDRINYQEILNTRLCDFRFKIKESFLEPLIKQVKEELKAKKICIKPRFFISNEWFCPDSSIAVSIPFYLFHKKLIKLEKEFIGYAEGANKSWALKLLRHETGHAIDNAFRLRRKSRRSKIFGKATVKYPISYSFKQHSKNYVRHIEDGYAQAHPCEDFAETFAVWLDPISNWKNRYKSWPCFNKLLYVDRLMNEISGKKPFELNKEKYYALCELKLTYKEYLEEKQKKHSKMDDQFWDPALKACFSRPGSTTNKINAIKLIKQNKIILLEKVTKETSKPKYIVKNMLDSFEKRAQRLDFHVANKDNILSKIERQLSIKANEYIKNNKHYIFI
ncbi:MAG: putative zinc-binding metallopeptidase [Pseudomonadota bacterium]